MSNTEMVYANDQDFDSEISASIGCTEENYRNICTEMNLTDLVRNAYETYYGYQRKADRNTRAEQIEMQKLYIYYTMVEKMVATIKRRLEMDMKDVAVARNRNELISHIEGATGYLNNLQYEGSHGYYYTVGNEKDVNETVKFAKEVLNGIKGTRIVRTGALLYSKPFYYIYFVIDGIDAEFRIQVPNIIESISDRYWIKKVDIEKTPSDISICMQGFGSNIIRMVASGVNEEGLNEKFKDFLKQYREAVSTPTPYIERERKKYFSNETNKFGIAYFEGFGGNTK